jgi:thiamine-phosphate pyrophosphorylase
VLCLVTQRGLGPHPLPVLVEAAVAAGVDWVQVRERELEGAALLAHAAELDAAARRGAAARHDGRPVRVLVNRRLDVGLALDAAGVHLGFDAVGVADARLLLGSARLVGVSAHAPAEVAAAAREGASYAFLAPIFEPRSKPATRRPVGLDALAEACRLGLPVLAQGGVDCERVPSLLDAGAAGVALTGEVQLADDPASACARLRRALDRAA